MLAIAYGVVLTASGLWIWRRVLKDYGPNDGGKVFEQRRTVGGGNRGMGEIVPVGRYSGPFADATVQ